MMLPMNAAQRFYSSHPFPQTTAGLYPPPRVYFPTCTVVSPPARVHIPTCVPPPTVRHPLTQICFPYPVAPTPPPVLVVPAVALEEEASPYSDNEEIRWFEWLLRFISHLTAYAPRVVPLNKHHVAHLRADSLTYALRALPIADAFFKRRVDRFNFNFLRVTRPMPGELSRDRFIIPYAVSFRDDFHAFNRRHEFALRTVTRTDGHSVLILFYKERSSDEWKPLPMPEGVSRFSAIAADNEYLVAISSDNRRVYTLLLIDKSLDNPRWTSDWGSPLWRGKRGLMLPLLFISWCFAHFSCRYNIVSADRERAVRPDRRHCTSDDVKQLTRRPRARDFMRLDGRTYKIVGVGVTTLFIQLHYSFLQVCDPWLLEDDFRGILGPMRGRIHLATTQASASMLMGLAKDGRVYIRAWDIDVSGANKLIIHYHSKAGRFGRRIPRMNPDIDRDWWEKQPPLPADVIMTGQVSIVGGGTGLKHYLLQVEGYQEQDGVLHYGFYFKEAEWGVPEAEKMRWQFFSLGIARREDVRAFKPEFAAAGGPILHQAPFMYDGDSSPQSGHHWFPSLQLRDFNPYEGPADIFGTIHGSDTRIQLYLHNIDPIRLATSRTQPDLDDTEWKQKGLLQLPRNVAERLVTSSNPRERAFFDLFKGSDEGYFVKAKIVVTRRELKVSVPTHLLLHETWAFNLTSQG